MNTQSKAALSVLLLCATAIVLVGLHNQVGWWLWLAAAVAAAIPPGLARVRLLTITGSLAVLGLTDISTNLSLAHILSMGALLALAVALPFAVLTFGFSDPLVKDRVVHARPITRGNVVYVLCLAAAAFVVLPFYLANSGSYHNWMVLPGWQGLSLLFACVMGLGTWDELFFDVTVFGIFQEYLPMLAANLAQATIWTAFLYRLGFRGWGPIIIFAFTLMQGFNFQRTRSFAFILATHLTLDLVLFLALVRLYL